MKRRIEHGLEAAKQYASVAKLRALPDGTEAICITGDNDGELDGYTWWRGLDDPFTSQLARDLRSPRLVAFAISIPEAQGA